MKISVILCCFNEEKYIERALRSVLSQKCEVDYEVIIIDDCSTDSTPRILRHFEDRVRIFTNTKNMGIGYSSQKGVELSQGHYFVRVDGDDYVSEYFVQILYMAITEGKHAAVSSDYYIVDEFGSKLFYGSAVTNPIACGVIYNKDLLISIGGYEKALALYEDKDLRRRFTAKYPIINLPIPLYRYRAHKDNSTGKQSVLSHGTTISIR